MKTCYFLTLRAWHQGTAMALFTKFQTITPETTEGWQLSVCSFTDPVQFHHYWQH